MRRCFYLILVFTIFSSAESYSQVIENAGDYMTQISSARVEMDQKYMAYISAAAHSRRARKVEKLRGQTI